MVNGSKYKGNSKNRKYSGSRKKTTPPNVSEFKKSNSFCYTCGVRINRDSSYDVWSKEDRKYRITCENCLESKYMKLGDYYNV